MTREEYLTELKNYFNEKMAEVQSDGTRHPLAFWSNFIREKEIEFQAQLESVDA